MIIMPKGFKPTAFVIGPMGEGKGQVGGVDIAQHIPNIKEALNIANEGLKSQGLQTVRLVTPNDAVAHSINDFVLRNIDTCDIGIADISDRSPNVFYELSYMHALGIPVIIFDSKDSQQRSPLPWYAQLQHTNTVSSFLPEELSKFLLENLIKLLGKQVNIEVFSNPISAIYDHIPLVDISAAAGLAAGHFDNFLKHVLSIEYGPFSYKKGVESPLKSLIIVRPENVQDLGALESQFRSNILSTENKFQPKSRTRPLVYKEYKNHIIDFPNPLSVLLSSPRYLRVSKLLQASEDSAKKMLLKIEKKWIETYFDTLLQYELHGTYIFKNKLKFMPLSKIMKL